MNNLAAEYHINDADTQNRLKLIIDDWLSEILKEEISKEILSSIEKGESQPPKTYCKANIVKTGPNKENHWLSVVGESIEAHQPNDYEDFNKWFDTITPVWENIDFPRHTFELKEEDEKYMKERFADSITYWN